MSAMLRSVRAARFMRQPVRACQPAFMAFVRTYASKFPEHTVIDMPALSPTMEQGNIGTWRKAVGDKLQPGDVLVEIETDKATMDFEFQDEGYLAQILLPEGSKDIAVGKPIGIFVEEAEDVAAFKDFTLADAGPGSAKAPVAEAPEKAEEPVKKEEASSQPAASTVSAPVKETPAEAHGRIFASPIAKMIALEKGIKLSDVKGTGPNGRIIKRDVESYVPAAAPAAASASSSAAAPAATAAYEDVPISQMRKVIAQRLSQSKHTSPDYIVSSTISVSKLLKLRQSLNESSNGEYKISVNDILVKAIARANKKVPAVNSAWLESENVIRQYKTTDVSVAVATPTGLITPVVKNVDAHGLAEISATTKDLAKRARENKLKPEEFQGGTITISNMGMNHAVSMFTAIINPPHAAIIAVGTVERKAIEDPAAEFGISFDDTITVTATFDHRVVDGAVGGEWMKALKQLIENPLHLLL